MKGSEYNEILEQLKTVKDKISFSIIMGVIPVPRPIILEAWRHFFITGLYKNINEEFEMEAIDALNDGGLINYN